MGIQKMIRVSAIGLATVTFYQMKQAEEWQNSGVLPVYANENLVHDVTIKWLDYNTEVYLGSELEFMAFLPNDAAFINFEWTANQNGIIELTGNNQHAYLRAVATGEVEVAACVPDGTQSCLHRNLLVKAYEQSEAAQALIRPGIRAVMQSGITEKNLYVEVEASLEQQEQIETLTAYFPQLYVLGAVNLIGSDPEHHRFNYYTFSIADQKQQLTIRVDKLQSGYEQLMTIIENYEQYLQKPEEPSPEVPEEPSPEVPEEPSPEVPEEPSPEVPEEPSPEVPEQPSPEVPEEPSPEVPEEPSPEVPEEPSPEVPEEPSPEVPEEPSPEVVVPPTFDLTLGNPVLTVVKQPNQDGSLQHPYTVTVKPTLSQEQQQLMMRQYIFDLMQFFKVVLVQRDETTTQIVYTYQVSKKFQRIFQEASGNDFYIEFIIDKDKGTSVYLIEPPVKPEGTSTQQSVVNGQQQLILQVEAQTIEALPQGGEQVPEILAPTDTTAQADQDSLQQGEQEQSKIETVSKAQYAKVIATGMAATTALLWWQMKKR